MLLLSLTVAIIYISIVVSLTQTLSDGVRIRKRIWYNRSMELKKQYEKIRACFPTQRKPAKIGSLDVLNAVLYTLM